MFQVCPRSSLLKHDPPTPNSPQTPIVAGIILQSSNWWSKLRSSGHFDHFLAVLGNVIRGSSDLASSGGSTTRYFECEIYRIWGRLRIMIPGTMNLRHSYMKTRSFCAKMISLCRSNFSKRQCATNWGPLHTRHWGPVTVSLQARTSLVEKADTTLRARDRVTPSTHSHWWKRQTRSKFATHVYAWGTDGVWECKMDVKSSWIPMCHQIDHVSWSLGLFWIKNHLLET
jgi:hypothetical protein